MTERHPLQDQMNFVQEYLFSRAIPFEQTPTRWGVTFEAEGVRIQFNKRTCNIYFQEVTSHEKRVEWNWVEELLVPEDDEARGHFIDWLRKACLCAHYAWFTREITKAPEWIKFFTTIKEGRTGNEQKIRVTAHVKLDILGRDPWYKYLDGEEYVVVNLCMNDHESDRISFRHFSNMVHALGSPVGSSFTDGHAPEAHNNFMEGGPWTFVPAKATIHTTSQYVLPEDEPESWDIFVLVRTHDVKMVVPQKEQK
uniref:Uncharacterized protein n=1 Tax=Pseudomonas phage HRDY3 TaxID=3236930 RepID=A0AB39CD93_9VIRU